MRQDGVWNLDAPWSMGSEDYRTLLRYLDTNMSGLIVELGSGESTFQFAEDFAHATIVALENEPGIREQNDAILRYRGHKTASVVFAPVRIQHWGLAVFSTYDFGSLLGSAPIDLLVVDGPVERLFPMGREAALYFLFNKLAVGGVIALDDYHRRSAKVAVANWLAMFMESLIIEEETASFAVLRKVSACSSISLPLQLILRSYGLQVRSLTRRGRRALSQLIRGRHSE
jgi:hypothetical protein